MPLLAESLNERFARLNRQLRNAELPSGMTQERLSVLGTIAARGPMTVSALAENELVRPATMSRMISALVADGYVRRDHNQKDGRNVLISATARGRKEFARAQQLRLQRLAAALSSLPAEELALMQDLASALEKLTAVLNGPE